MNEISNALGIFCPVQISDTGGPEEEIEVWNYKSVRVCGSGSGSGRIGKSSRMVLTVKRKIEDFCNKVWAY